MVDQTFGKYKQYYAILLSLMSEYLKTRNLMRFVNLLGILQHHRLPVE